MIQRSVSEHTITGRTLEGIALFWDRPARVVDPGKPAYVEAYARASANKTMADRPNFPLAYWHGLLPETPWGPGQRSRYAAEAMGTVIFRATAEGLTFEARLLNSRSGDEMKEQLEAGALGDVSIAAWPIRTSKRPGIDAYREEIAIGELSLAPVGKGQLPGAKVLAMRAEPAIDNRARMRALKLRMK